MYLAFWFSFSISYMNLFVIYVFDRVFFLYLVSGLMCFVAYFYVFGYVFFIYLVMCSDLFAICLLIFFFSTKRIGK
jgi:hypothetical protein